MAFNESNTSESASTSLLQVCREGNVGLVWELLSSPSCDLLACDEDGNTALHLAAEQGHLAVVQELAGRYTTPSAGKNTKGRTPLHLASMRGHSAVVEALAQRFPGDLEVRDEYGDTPLHLAALFGHMETVDLLCQQFHCDPSVKGLRDRTALHHGCSGGHLGLVEKLIVEYKCCPVAKDIKGKAPLHCAAYCGHTDIVFKLVSVHGCSLTVKCTEGATVLHQACSGGHLSLAKKLISDYGFDPMERDDDGITSLHWAGGSTDPLAPIGNFHLITDTSHVNTVRMLVTEYKCPVDCVDSNGDTALNHAALNGHAEVVGVLISEFGCSPSVKGQYGRTPLHNACNGGHLDVVEKLVSEYGCDVNARDNDGRTPLHVAALAGREEVVRELITKYKCSVNCVDSDGGTPLHWAAMEGHVGVVRMLLSEFGADVSVCINNGDTALNLAAFSGHVEIVGVLISEFGCSPSVKGFNGRTPLHQACNGGHLDVVEKLVSEYGCDVNARDNDGLTPLHVAAAWCGREEVVRELITKYKCPVDCVDSDGDTPLHWAAMKGHVGVVRMLLSEFGAYVSVYINNGDTALNLAAFNGHAEVVGVLISEFGCSPSVKGQYGRTPLHHACDGGHLDVVKMLTSKHVINVNAKDDDSRTPLYYAIQHHHSSIVAELVRHNSDLTHVDSAHKKLIESATRLTKKARTMVFVVGTPEVGKSTLVKALQSETLFKQKVKQVPAHTAGIVPVFHESSSYGWVVFYDFAGDEEYYSSHAAILERIMGSSSKLFLLVFDLTKFSGSIEKVQEKYDSIYYWLTFLSYRSNDQQESSKLQVVLIGSHADVLQKEGKDADRILSEFFTDISQSFYTEFPNTSVEMFGYVALNCCLTKSQGLQKIKAQLKQAQLSSLSDAPQLTAGASILLGTLERDFKGEVACRVKEVIEHIKSHKLYLPPEAEQLHSYLKELHACGLVLLLECTSPREDEWIVLNISLFLSTVHKKLFSAPLPQHKDSLSNLGIIPSTRLQTLFPEFPLTLLKGCLTLLQYCQEINDPQIISKVLKIPTVETISNESVLFFPALLQTSREEVKWIRSHSSLCCIGWCAECFRTYDFFPPRFLHVLLLRLAFTFALPNTSGGFDDDDDGATAVDVYSRKCTLWKNGIHWLMESGVEVVVEVVKQKRVVLVMVRGNTDQQVECGDILNKVVTKVVEAKSEFCNVLKAKCYIVSPDDLKQSTVPEADKLQLFETRNIQEVLLKGSEGAVGRDGKGFLPSSDLTCLQTQTSWSEYACAWSKVSTAMGKGKGFAYCCPLGYNSR